ncbi:MAG: hypothetical protein IKL55_02740 [Clostridia bacterium]|nr:hypothetical protein [Clostridia bacterium]
MNRILEERKLNKMKVLIVISIMLLIVFLVIFLIHKKREEVWNNIDTSNAIHGVIIDKNIGFYRKPKISKWKFISNLDLGQNVYIVDEFKAEDGKHWYKLKANDKVGYVEKEYVDTFKFIEDDGYVLMSDVSKFNLINKNFKSSGEYGAFLLKYDINYVYIRAGGRGYGDEGNFYTDPNFKMFIEECEFLEIPYGFYYIDEAITEEELDEEVLFIKDFLDKNKTKMCKLPLVIDVEDHEGKGRAKDLWEERAELVSNLISKFKEKNIDTIVYTNANLADEYLYEIDTKFWIAYYDLKNEIPKVWYTETDQEAAQNEELKSKIIGWQFSETGIEKNTEYPVDFSVVNNEFFREYVK